MEESIFIVVMIMINQQIKTGGKLYETESRVELQGCNY